MTGDANNGNGPRSGQTERRANPRTRLRDLACIHVGPDNGAIVLDASDGGILFYAVAPLEQTGIIQLTFSLWDDRRVDAVAKLAWIDGARKSGGLEFISVPAEALEYIRNCCLPHSFPSRSEKKTGPAQPPSENRRNSMAARILAAEEIISKTAEEPAIAFPIAAKAAPAESKAPARSPNGSNGSRSEAPPAGAGPGIFVAPQAPLPKANAPQVAAKAAPAEPKTPARSSNGSNGSRSEAPPAGAGVGIFVAPQAQRPKADAPQVAAKAAPAEPQAPAHSSNGSNGSRSEAPPAGAGVGIFVAPQAPRPNAAAPQVAAKAAPAKPQAPARSPNGSNVSRSEAPPAGASLGISFAPQGSRPNVDAWKKMIGEKPVPARLSTLPESRLSGSALASSTAFQALLVLMMLSLPALFPQVLATKILYDVVPIAAPDTSVPLPPKAPVVRTKPQAAPPAEPLVPQPRVARLTAPRTLTPPKPKSVDVRAAEVPEISQPITPVKIDPPSAEPARPREPIKTGLLTTGSAAPATVVAPIAKVQTGGFGDPNGLPGTGDPNQRANIAHLGSPALPSGPGEGNGSGGASGIRGTVASAGFGNGVAVAPQGGPAPARGEVKSGGFAAAVADTGSSPRPKASETAAGVQSVVILDKPNPVYSAEARQMGIEGEVLVEVVFPASGPVQIVRVVKGLGHGLDEAAVRAAQQIRFKPAVQNGPPVNFPAVVHIVFQLAF